jgi:hypothetical protein
VVLRGVGAGWVFATERGGGVRRNTWSGNMVQGALIPFQAAMSR